MGSRGVHQFDTEKVIGVALQVLRWHQVVSYATYRVLGSIEDLRVLIEGVEVLEGATERRGSAKCTGTQFFLSLRQSLTLHGELIQSLLNLLLLLHLLQLSLVQ